MNEKHCVSCKYKYTCTDEFPCIQCYNVDGYPKWEPYDENDEKLCVKETPVTDDKNISMIKSIIEEAMAKKDRSVSIYIHDGSISITVTPLGVDEPRWIRKEDHWECSVCGAFEKFVTRYCANCGEALKIGHPELKKVEDTEKFEEKTKGVDFSKSCRNCKHKWDPVINMMKNLETGEESDEDSVCEHCYNYDEFEPEIPEKGEMKDGETL